MYTHVDPQRNYIWKKLGVYAHTSKTIQIDLIHFSSAFSSNNSNIQLTEAIQIWKCKNEERIKARCDCRFTHVFTEFENSKRYIFND